MATERLRHPQVIRLLLLPMHAFNDISVSEFIYIGVTLVPMEAFLAMLDWLVRLVG